MTIQEIINGIREPDNTFYKRAKQHFDKIAKPIGSFGKLEDIIAQICSIQESDVPNLNKRACAVFCSDNGIVEEGVSQVGQFVTANVFNSICDGEACVCTLGKNTNTDVFAFDVGVNSLLPKDKGYHYKISIGTDNFLKGPAMKKSDCEKAILTGFEAVEILKGMGFNILIAGEMGIGNTTTSSAVLSCLLGLDPKEVTGRGAGLSDKGLERKITVIREGISLNSPDKDDVIDVLSKVGGFDIAAMCGFYLGCAYHKIPCIIDGFIALTAALCAVKLNTITVKYLISSHKSSEKGVGKILEVLKLNPILDGNFHQGEGCGALSLLPLIDLTNCIYTQQQSFDDMEMKPYERFD